MRDGAVVARRAHNPKVIGSSPVPATKKSILLRRMLFCLKLLISPLVLPFPRFVYLCTIVVRFLYI
jgi:hypothetical protein